MKRGMSVITRLGGLSPNHKKIYNLLSFFSIMPNPTNIKERILYLLKNKGPSLPVHVSTELKTSILFSSAFLGELYTEKEVKMSHLRVGSSPLYYIPGQEPSLENFANHLKSKEKDAFLLLKERGFLPDSTQSPAIRVALREIRDFAIPFKSGEEIIWRYFTIPEEEFKAKEEKTIVMEIKEPVKIEEKIEKTLEIQEKEAPKKEVLRAKLKRKKASGKKMHGKEENFFNDVKDFISENSMDIVDIKGFGKKEVVLKINDKGEEKLLIAYNKNKISENDIITASKKASKEGLPYMILGVGGPLKKLDSLIEALKGLSSIKKVK